MIILIPTKFNVTGNMDVGRIIKPRKMKRMECNEGGEIVVVMVFVVVAAIIAMVVDDQSL